MPAHKKYLRVLSLNMHKGFGVGNLRFTLRELKSAIQSVNADLVLLQEVQGAHKKREKRIKSWPEESQFEFLADKLWPHFAYGRNAVYELGHHGNAILSKYPLSDVENIDISRSRFAKRGLLHAVVDIPHVNRVHILNVHLDLLKKSRMEQVNAISARIAKAIPKNAPLLLGGDFNDWTVQASQVFEKKCALKEAFLETHGDHAKTFPSALPSLRLDRLYFRKLGIISARSLSGNPWRRLSDHVAVLAELKL